MSKRFTDSEKFRDIWYRKLSPVMKCFWEYLLSECDNAGIIDIDFESASFHIGADVTENDLAKYDGRVIKLPDGKYFIPKFIEFQQGELNPLNNAHKPIIEKLGKYGYTLNKPFDEFLTTLKGSFNNLKRESKGGSEGVITPPSNGNSNSKGNSNIYLNTTMPRAREKMTFEKVVDWESLFDYWEQHKKGGKYKNAESRNRMFAKLKDLTNDDFELAKEAITYAIDNNYQGFTDGSRLFYRNVSAAPASRKTADEAAFVAEVEKRLAAFAE